ncbi:hypothetical protein GCM10008171_27320 [Methylopila jiangsuensis]|uniref:histidine kinase n=1 Tax=Methylopila jiangsuensis TaxID=586230 RepID=A0A9W6JJS3_9HYPH|nr:ATP-binding protein [Methylopila jiangsuensis]MDR6285135.1 signal transduction histidine kinase/CheY-like chemotaxis protein [Methylopila jiangsuensis]GLK77478.1 hypothetical protein GCM10008171_27320 [Methylopila jiangsuensis]
MTLIAILAGVGLVAALLVIAALLRRASAHDAEMERLRDALWRSTEQEERARADGAAALALAREQADEGARAKSRFLATVTHEMRTPLSGVAGAADLLLGTALAPEQRTYAQAVRSSAEAMLGLVDEILDMSRIEAGKVALQPAPFDPAAVAEQVAELLAPRAQAKGLDFAVFVAPDAPARITADAARLRQILLNLAGNAVKFTDAGGVGLRVEPAGAGLRFSVCDTGPGFDPADAARLFGEFERGADEAGAPGVGLGLAISARLAEAMGGTIRAEATPGRGATFTLTLPARDAAPAATLETRLEGRRVAVLSDAPFSGPWLVERLALCGAEARLMATCGAAADQAEALKAFAADTALIDRPGGERAPADLALAARLGGVGLRLALLNPADRGELPGLAADGFDGFLVKPVRTASLVSRLTDPRPISASGALEPQDAPAPAGRGLKVLLAEDDEVSALIATAHLKRLGHAPTRARDGLAALEALTGAAFDAALLDIRMPGLDGLAVARRVRAREAESGARPLLMLALSANASDEDRAATLAAGFDAALVKPLDSARLAELLDGCTTARVA